MISHSVTARLMTPLMISLGLLCLLASVIFIVDQRSSRANEASLTALDHVYEVSELRSISRALQRDALNLMTDTDDKQLAEINRRFALRLGQFAQGLARLRQLRDAEVVPQTYFDTQNHVIQALHQTAALAHAGQRDAAMGYFHTQLRPAEREASRIADKSIEALKATAHDRREDAALADRQGRYLLLLATALLILSGLVSSLLLIRRGVAAPLHDLTQAMTRLAQGHLNDTIAYTERPDEIGQMARSMAAFREHILAAQQATEAQAETIVATIGAGLSALAQADLTHRIDRDLDGRFSELVSDFNQAMEAVARLVEAVEQVTHSVQQDTVALHDAAQGLEQRSGEQAAGIADIGVTMRHLIDGIQTAAAGAQDVSALAVQASDQTSDARGVVADADLAMTEIQSSTQRIGQIVTLIEGIALQTNLLALNAGVEAARAGDAGRGFAVVATEVRALAQRSAAAASDIKALIEASIKQVHRGGELFSRSGQAFETIAGQVGAVSARAETIANQTSLQAAGMQQIDSVIRTIAQATRRNEDIAQGTSHAVANLTAQVEYLNKLIAGFRLDRSSAKIVELRGRRRA